MEVVICTEKTFRQIVPLCRLRAKGEIENLPLHVRASHSSNELAGRKYSGFRQRLRILHCSQQDLIKPDEYRNQDIYELKTSSANPTDINTQNKLRKARN